MAVSDLRQCHHAPARLPVLRHPRRRHMAPWDLTHREFDVLQLLVLRWTNQEIASQLYISSRTVESHVASILDKLGVANRHEAARYAVQQGLVAHSFGFTTPHFP